MRAYVDQIAGGKAQLRLGEAEQIPLTLPLDALPAGTREGEVLQLHFTRDDAGTKADAEANDKLREELLKRSKDVEF